MARWNWLIKGRFCEKYTFDWLFQLESGLAFREIKVEGGTPLNYSLNISPFFCLFKKSQTAFNPFFVAKNFIFYRIYRMSHRYWANLSIWVHKRVQEKPNECINEYGSRFPSTGPLIVFYLGPGSRVRVQVPEYGFWTFFLNFFANLFKNVLSFIFGLLLDAVLVCHVIWVVGFQSGLKKIGSSQIYEVEKLAQYRWDIRYFSSKKQKSHT